MASLGDSCGRGAHALVGIFFVERGALARRVSDVDQKRLVRCLV